MEKKVRDLEKKVADVERGAYEKDSKITTAERAKTDAENRLGDLERRNRELEKKQMEESTKSSTSDEQVKVLRDQVQTLTSKLATAEGQAQMAQAEAKAKSDLLDQARTAAANAVASAPSGDNSAVEAQLRAEIASLKSESAGLKAQLETARSTNTQIQAVPNAAAPGGQREAELESELNKAHMFASRLRQALGERDERMVHMEKKMTALKKKKNGGIMHINSGGFASMEGSGSWALTTTPGKDVGSRYKAECIRVAQMEVNRLEREREEAVFMNQHLMTRLSDMDDTLRRLRGSLITGNLQVEQISPRKNP
eukprot:gene11279-13328_t